MSRDRLLALGAIGVGVVLILAVAIAAWMSLQLRPSGDSIQGPHGPPCEPKPCVDVQRFTLWISDLKIDSGIVSMKLRFVNSSDSTHADPSDIRSSCAGGFWTSDFSAAKPISR